MARYFERVRQNAITQPDDETKTIACVLYPDEDPAHAEAFRRIIDGELKKDDAYLGFAAIAHTDDVKDDGSPLKSHTHVVLMYDKNRTLKRVASDLGLYDLKKGNAVQKAGSRVGVLRYLIHLDNPDKFHYDRSCIVFDPDIKDVLDDALSRQKERDENSDAAAIFDLLDSYDRCVSITEITKELLSRGLYHTWRSSFVMWRSILNEHNDRIKEKKSEKVDHAKLKAKHDAALAEIMASRASDNADTPYDDGFPGLSLPFKEA